MPSRRSSVDHRQAADPVLDHQGCGLLEVHLRLAGDERARGALLDRVSGSDSAARARTARSRSVTIAQGAPEPSMMTTDPTEWSRISLATARTLSDGLAVTTFAVMISCSCTA